MESYPYKNYKIVDADLLDADLTRVANAIREKGGTSDALDFPEGFVSAVEAIKAGGGGDSVPKKDVNFYDYDCTLLHSYTVAEAQELTELPALPEREGLICQGWNWSLEDIKEHNRAVDVGATYTTDDGTTRIYIHLEDGRTSPMLGVCPNGTVTVDWGDGTEPDTLTGTKTTSVKWTPNHEYAEPGDYVIKLTVDGTMGLSGLDSQNAHSYILRHTSSTDGRNNAYQTSVKKVELGDNVTSIGSDAFDRCYSLKSVVIPNSVTSIDTYAFQYCYSLASVVIPNSVTSIGGYAFYNCYSLASVVIPNSVTSIGGYIFVGCYSLASVVIPNSVTTISSNAFSSCYSLASVVIPNSVTAIKSRAFYYCYGVRYYDFTKHTAVPTLAHTDAFSGIAADCEIRVPAALYDEWIAATNWATYASYIKAA